LGLIKSSTNFIKALATSVTCLETMTKLANGCPMAMQTRKYTVSIEGNIGSGKTTLLNHFQNSSNVQVLPEPVSKWRCIEGLDGQKHNGLELMYTDPSRWSLTFQTYVQLTMLEQHKVPLTHDVKLMERSIYSARYCFVENLHRSGKMPDVEYVVLDKWFDWIVKNQEVGIDLIVYLQTSPEVLHERIKQRCRREETAIPLEYLQRLHELHEDWLIHHKFPIPAGAKVMIIKADGSQEDMVKEYETKENQILCRSIS